MLAAGVLNEAARCRRSGPGPHRSGSSLLASGSTQVRVHDARRVGGAPPQTVRAQPIFTR